MIYDPKLPSWVKIHFSLFESLYTYKFMCVYVCVCLCVCVCVCVLFILGCFHFQQRRKIQQQEMHGGKLLIETLI